MVWLLVWIYGGAILRWRWLNETSMEEEPCLLTRTWVLFGLIHIGSALLAVGVYGGLAAIIAEVFGNICHTSFSLHIPIWISIGFLAVAVFVCINLIIIFFQAGKSCLHFFTLTALVKAIEKIKEVIVGVLGDDDEGT
jgi:hypothetical protein